MQTTRPERNNNPLSDALAWLELTYSNLKIDRYVLVGVIALLIGLMGAGAYQEAVRQASMTLGIMPEQDAALMTVVAIVNQYGLAVLVGVCYFSNVTQGGRRRELLVDGLSIGLGLLIPQLVFHAAWVYTTHALIAANALTVNHALVSAINHEWLIVWGISMLLTLIGVVSWRLYARLARAEADGAAPVSKGDGKAARRA